MREELEKGENFLKSLGTKFKVVSGNHFPTNIENKVR